MLVWHDWGMLPCSILTVRFITELSMICVLCVQWFEERALQLETLDSQLKKLHSSIETLVMHRRGLSVSLCAALRHSSCTAEVRLSLSVQHWDTRHAPQRCIETLVMHRRGPSVSLCAALRHSSCTAEVRLSLSVQHWDTRHAPQRSVSLSFSVQWSVWNFRMAAYIPTPHRLQNVVFHSQHIL